MGGEEWGTLEVKLSTLLAPPSPSPFLAWYQDNVEGGKGKA